MRTVSWALSALLVSAAVAGCEKSAETQKAEAERAAMEAEKKTTEAAKEAEQKAREARESVDKDRSELHATVMREKVDYRSKLNDALDRIDKDLMDHKVDVKQVKRGDRSKDASLLGNRPAKESAAIQASLTQRDRVMDLTDEIDKTNDQDWPSLKQRIDRELQEDKPIKGRI